METIRRALEPLLVGRRVVDCGAHPSAKFSPATDALDATFTSVGRRGKYLVADLSDRRQMVVHLGMTGVLHLRPESREPYVRAWWRLDNNQRLVFEDVRRFGRIAVVTAGDYRTLPTLHAIGPEPLSEAFTPEGLWQAVRKSRVRLKTQLLNQRCVAGVGNIYADEALFEAGVHPGLRRLTRAQAARLVPAIQLVLERGLANGGTTLRDYRTVDGATGNNQRALACYGRAGARCIRCGDTLKASVIDARSTTHCPTCQAR